MNFSTVYSPKKDASLRLGFFAITFMILFLFSFHINAQNLPAEQQNEMTQTNFDDQELQQFASAAGKVMMIQQETEQKMLKAIEDENLEVDKFNEILRTQQGEEAQTAPTEDEMQSFNNAAEKIIRIQTDVQSDMMRAIQEEGLEPQKYEQILAAYQSDPALKARVDAILHTGETTE